MLRICLLAFCLALPAGCTREPDQTGTTKAPAVPTQAAAPAAPERKPLPSYWFDSEVDKWRGKKWGELELIQYLPTPPRGLDQGTRYVVFYSRTCDHCEVMFNDDFAADPELASRTTAVLVPASKTERIGSGAWSLPSTKCEMLELPLGVNWVITTPLAIRIENGYVTCAQEGAHEKCFGLE